MKIRTAIGLAPIVALVMLASSARAETPALSDEELDVLRVIVGCKHDSTPDYCAPFRPLVARLARTEARRTATSGATVQPANSPVPNPPGQDAVAVDNGRALTFASGHAPGPVGQSSPPHGGANVTFAAATDTKQASLSLDVDLSALNGGYPRTLSITAQAPFDQDQGYSNLATQDGMAKSSAIGVQFTQLGGRHTSRRIMRNSAEYQTACQTAARDLKALKTSVSDADIDDYLPPNLCSADLVAQLLKKATGVSGKDRAALLAKLTAAEQMADGRLDSLWLFSEDAKVGYEKHAFYDSTTLDKAKVDRTTFELGLGMTRVFHQGDMSATLSYKYQRHYKDGGADEEAKIVCHTNADATLKCVNGFIGHPLRDEEHLFSADFRYISAGLFGVPFAVDPMVAYDAHSGVYGVQVPLYVLANKGAALTGGLRYDWTSDKHQSVVGVFVTSAFCILPGYSGCPTGAEKDKDGS